MKSLNPTDFVVRQLERHEQSEDLEPGTEGHQGRKPRVPSNGQNLGNKDPAPWVTSLPLAYLWSCGLDPRPFTSPVTQFWPILDLSSPSILLFLWDRPHQRGNEQGAAEQPLSIEPAGHGVLTCIKYTWASVASASGPGKQQNQSGGTTTGL